MYAYSVTICILYILYVWLEYIYAHVCVRVSLYNTFLVKPAMVYDWIWDITWHVQHVSCRRNPNRLTKREWKTKHIWNQQPVTVGSGARNSLPRRASEGTTSSPRANTSSMTAISTNLRNHLLGLASSSKIWKWWSHPPNFKDPPHPLV